MHRQTLQDPISKRMMRWGWSTLLGAHAFASLMTAGSGRTPAVFYGGARPGDIGGPLVKIKRLSRSYHRADYVFYQSGFCRDCAKKSLDEHQGPGSVRWRCALRTCGLYRTAAGCVRGKRWLKTRRYSNS